MRKIVNSMYSMRSEQPPRSLAMSFTEEEIGYLRSNGGDLGRASQYMRITPTVSWSWNLEGRPTTHDRPVVYRRVVHKAAVKPGA
jgi:hypothetical protein